MGGGTHNTKLLRRQHYKVNIMQNVKLVAKPNHNPRTSYNLAMWQALQKVSGINSAKGVPVATLHAALMEAVPNQSTGHCTAHIAYWLRQKAALQVVASK